MEPAPLLLAVLLVSVTALPGTLAAERGPDRSLEAAVGTPDGGPGMAPIVVCEQPEPVCSFVDFLLHNLCETGDVCVIVD